MTLTDLQTKVSALLMDAGKVIWDDDAITEAIRQALADYGLFLPLMKQAILTLEEDSSEIDLSSLVDLSDVVAVTFPWLGEESLLNPGSLPGWTLSWDALSPSLVLRTANQQTPTNGQQVRLLYTAGHTLEGLDSALTSTIDARHEAIIARGAAGYAARARAISRAEGFKSAHASAPSAAQSMLAWSTQFINGYLESLLGLRSRGGGQVPSWTEF